MPTRDLNIGMIGYGFMGRCHSNAFRTAPNFFDLPRRPVLKAACGRDEAKERLGTVPEIAPGTARAAEG